MVLPKWGIQIAPAKIHCRPIIMLCNHLTTLETMSATVALLCFAPHLQWYAQGKPGSTFQVKLFEHVLHHKVFCIFSTIPSFIFFCSLGKHSCMTRQCIYTSQLGVVNLELVHMIKCSAIARSWNQSWVLFPKKKLSFNAEMQRN